MKPGQILTLGFLFVIVSGALLLSLPFATVKEGTDISFLDALFTATSAVCVTGLTVVNTGVVFTMFGHIVILCLIQIGGLGFMTMTSLIFLVIGKRISLRERLIIRESFNSDSLQGMVRLVRNAVGVALVVEAIGALILAVRLIPEFGFGMGIFHAIFLAISAFCNAGFDAFGYANSLEEYVKDPTISLVIMSLITLGGMGFAVILDILHHRRFSKLMLHSRVVLFMSGLLFVMGAVIFGLLEWNNPATLGRDDLHVWHKMLASCFQSVTTRTAGFDNLGQGNLTPAGQLFSVVLMFIGASPASTGGGIKTTTFFVILLSIMAIVREKQDYNFHGRRLNPQVIRRALALFVLSLCLVVADTLIISAVETWTGRGESLADVLFEVTSAFGTVGLSTGITAGLHSISKVLVMTTMFCGRVGLLTISMALSGGIGKSTSLRYPEDRIMVG